MVLEATRFAQNKRLTIAVSRGFSEHRTACDFLGPGDVIHVSQLLRRILYLLRRADRVLLLVPRRTLRLVLADFVRTMRLSLRRTGFTLALVAFLATWPSAATCPSVEPIFSATVTKTCFSLSTKLALFICSPSGGFCLPTPQLSWLA
jgi:hypothetical protein